MQNVLGSIGYRQLGLAFVATLSAFGFASAAVTLPGPQMRIIMRGGPLPKTLSLAGNAVAISSTRYKCNSAEHQLADPIIDLVDRFVKAEKNRRTWSASQLTTATEPRSGISATLVKSPNNSYVVQLDSSLLPLDRSLKILPAIYDCLKVHYGTADKAKTLGLIPALPSTGASAPQYSPAIGFYRIIRSSPF